MKGAIMSRQLSIAKRMLAALVIVFAQSGCGFSSFFNVFPSEEELAAYEAEIAAFYEQIESLPQAQWHVINETTANIQVEFSTGSLEPSFPDDYAYFDPALVGGASPLTEIARRTLSIPPRGTATGNFKCGEIILVSADAPSIEIGADLAAYVRGLYVLPGNILLEGIGVSIGDSQGFSGDLLSGGRLLNPETDGIDCSTATMRLTILTLPTAAVIDPDSGEVLREAALGSGTLTVE